MKVMPCSNSSGGARFLDVRNHVPPWISNLLASVFMKRLTRMGKCEVPPSVRDDRATEWRHAGCHARLVQRRVGAQNLAQDRRVFRQLLSVSLPLRPQTRIPSKSRADGHVAARSRPAV